MTERQREVAKKIFSFSYMAGVDPDWALAVAAQESSLGENQLSPTGCRGVFQMSKVAMLDLWQEMVKMDDDLTDIACGILFLRLLLRRWGTIEEATAHFCDPRVKEKYVASVLKKMEESRRIGK